MTQSLNFSEWSKDRLRLTESVLSESVPPAAVAPQALHQAMRYAVLDGGKRVRPLLTFAAAEMIDADPQVAAIAGAAVEMIHAYSLVHDDLPCMDNDVLRRGKPTVHVAFGEANALLVGDSLQPLAFALLVGLRSQISQTNTLQMIAELATASGSLGMAGGQAIDLQMVGSVAAGVDQQQLEQMHRLKTGAILRCATILGGWSGDLEPPAHLIHTLEIYSRAIGLAFQVVDDCLDVSADTATLGKTAGKDELAGKPTYVALMGLSGAQQYAQRLHEEAIAAVESFEPLKSRRLRELAGLIVSRSS